MNIILKSVLIINLLFSAQNFNLIEREDCRMLDQDSCEQSEFCMWVIIIWKVKVFVLNQKIVHRYQNV